jgi:steroid delta-isomerase-like uncharacterized protein
MIGAVEEKRQSDGNKHLMQRLYDELVNEGNLDVVDELLAETFEEHEEFPGIPPTREGVKQFFALFRTAFPDVTCEVEHMVAEGVFVSSHVRMHGTHQGEFMGVAATGRPFDVHVFDLVRFQDGLATAHWGVFDAMTLMQQLGAIPEPPPAAPPA